MDANRYYFNYKSFKNHLKILLLHVRYSFFCLLLDRLAVFYPNKISFLSQNFDIHFLHLKGFYKCILIVLKIDVLQFFYQNIIYIACDRNDYFYCRLHALYYPIQVFKVGVFYENQTHSVNKKLDLEVLI